MTLEEIKEIINHKKNGQFMRVKMITDLNSKIKAAERQDNVLQKESVLTVRTGVSYTHIKAVQKALEEAGRTSEDVKPISWATSLQGYENVLLEHNSKPGAYYMRLYPVAGNKPQVKYTLNGKEISKEDLKESNIMQPSYWSPKEASSILVVGLDKIQEII